MEYGNNCLPYDVRNIWEDFVSQPWENIVCNIWFVWSKIKENILKCVILIIQMIELLHR